MGNDVYNVTQAGETRPSTQLVRSLSTITATARRARVVPQNDGSEPLQKFNFDLLVSLQGELVHLTEYKFYDVCRPQKPANVERSSGKEVNDESRESVRHGSLWFDDGNVILVAEKTLRFRVHRSLLSIYSPVFRDMFTLNRPETAEHVEGPVPIVHIQDEPSEVADFLSYIYYAPTIYKKGGTPGPKQIMSMLKLGLKYLADDIYEAAIFELERLFPGDIKQWDTSRNADSGIPWTTAELFTVANTLHEFNSDDRQARFILTRVVYECAQAPANELVSGTTDTSSGVHVSLAPPLLTRCLSAQKVLTLCTIDICARGYRFSCPHNSIYPNRSKRSLLRDEVESNLWKYIDTRPLAKHREYMDAMGEHLCGTCAYKAAEMLDNLRQDVLDSLAMHV